MKQVAIFYRNRENQPAIQYIENNLYSVLGDYIQVTNYYTNELSDREIIEADAYLVCYEEMLSYLVGHVHDFSKVIVITRSIQKKHLQPITRIPKATDVLVVNDSRESILQTIYMIYELGIGHINLIPYEESIAKNGGYSDVNHAIVAYYSEYMVPSHIEHVLNIHNREVSFETFQKLISLLGLETTSVQRNLIHKASADMDTGSNFVDSYLGNFLRDEMLSKVVEESSRAIILFDRNNVIYFINEKAYDLFHMNQGELFRQRDYLPSVLADSPDFTDEIITLQETNYLAEKHSITLSDELVGCYLILQNEKDLRETESNLLQQLKQTGFYARYNFTDIIHESKSMAQCINLAKKAAPSDYTILIRGESGTGKELLAQSIHNHSSRKNYPFVAVNCAAIPDTLLESELFGYEAGAFTGAQKGGKIGLFEHAQKGTIFLDEIGDISANLQSRLLRVIQEKQILRLGSNKIINIDVRIIAATNVDLEKQVAEGRFRKDLFYRLNVITLNVAPLRERKGDILSLMKVFMGKGFNDLLPKEKDALLSYSWPGNVRELENVASYYKLLGQIPDYLYSPNIALLAENRAEDLFGGTVPSVSMLSLSEADLKKQILEIIAKHSSSVSGIGRKALMTALSLNRTPVGEGILRKYLDNLKEEGLIQSSTGRAGTRITEKGLLYLAET